MHCSSSMNTLSQENNAKNITSEPELKLEVNQTARTMYNNHLASRMVEQNTPSDVRLLQKPMLARSSSIF